MNELGTKTRRPPGVLKSVEDRRRKVSSDLNPGRQRQFGQFLTPVEIAEFMASLVEVTGQTVRVLDPGAGVGSLVAALVVELCGRSAPPERIEVTAVEIDPDLAEPLTRTLAECRRHCRRRNVRFQARVFTTDFIEFAVRRIDDQLSLDRAEPVTFDLVIQNPPYRKINSTSRDRRLLQRVGLEISNVYAAFLALGAKLLSHKGELVAITPRSFCNGPYFKAFRRSFLEAMAFTRIHVIESRNEAFAEEGVLQENIIFKAVRGVSLGSVVVTSGNGSMEARFGRQLAYNQLVSPSDPDRFIHLVPEPNGPTVARRIKDLPSTLKDLGLTVSTGRVVDFRAREHLRHDPEADSAPLVYPAHFRGGYVAWPIQGKKPNALMVNTETGKLLVPEGVYVLVKRFSAKEEARRIVAAVFDPARTPAPTGVGFENHLNYFHADGSGLSRQVALGLTAFLNSTAVDLYFRQFSGHTQVNASDLRKLSYPTLATLVAIGSRMPIELPSQKELDKLVDPLLDRE